MPLINQSVNQTFLYPRADRCQHIPPLQKDTPNRLNLQYQILIAFRNYVFLHNTVDSVIYFSAPLSRNEVSAPMI